MDNWRIKSIDAPTAAERAAGIGPGWLPPEGERTLDDYVDALMALFADALKKQEASKQD